MAPGPLDRSSPFWPGHDARYRGLDPELLPLTECLKDTVQRVRPVWEEEIAPRVQAGEKILISAHGNSIRALIKHLEGISEADIIALDIPTAQPLVITLDQQMRFLKREYLADPKVIEAALRDMSHQGKAKTA
jgi:2,3-bisphosphoglycerate-dependent phosphoglycerate mutase